MIPTIHPVLQSLIGTGAGGDGMEALLVIALYFVLVALGVAMMTWQGITLIWFWRTSGLVDAEKGLRARRTTIFMVVNWVWLGVLAGIGYLLRDEGPLGDMWLFVWYPLAALAAMTVLHLMSLHRHTAVSFALLVGTLFYVQMVVPTAASRLQDKVHENEIRELFRLEAVSNRERFQREEFGQQQEREQIRLKSRWIKDTTSSLTRIAHLLNAADTINDAQKAELRLFFIGVVYSCHELRVSLKRDHTYEDPDQYPLLRQHINFILSWEKGPWLEGLPAAQVEWLQQYVAGQP